MTLLRNPREPSSGNRGKRKKPRWLGKRGLLQGNIALGKREKSGLPVRDFLGHVENQFAILFIGLAQQAAKLVEVTCLFAGASPRNVVRRLALRQIRQLRRLFTVVEQLIERDLECARQLFQRFNGGDGVAIFYARDVATE